MPVVMIAHGTGIAPFVSILHRMRNLEKPNAGPVRLFLGMRDDDTAFIYRQELLELAKDLGAKIYLAASRTLTGCLEGVTAINGYV
jgi:sulfite reductase alpha subunit-like flavoprotein